MPTHQLAKSNRSRQSTTLPSHDPAQDRATLSPVQALGNQFMQALQPKLTVNAPNDAYEQEADRMAGQVSQMAEPVVQRAGKEPEKKKESEKKKDESVQKKALAAQVTPLVQRATKAPEKKKDEEKKGDAKAGAVQKMDAGAPQADDERDLAQASALQRQEAPKKSDDEQNKPAQAKRTNPPQLNDDQEKKKPAGNKKEERKKQEEDKPAQTRAVQRAAKAGDKPEEPKKKKEEQKAVQKKDDGGGGAAAPAVERDVERQERGGRPLDPAVRGYFEPRFGADFSNVRVHDDAEAARTANQLNAQAFTRGEHIFFGAGRYQPDDSPGRQLLGHELTHTLQQGAATPAAPQAKPLQATPSSAKVIQRQGEEAADEEAGQPEPLSSTLDDTGAGDDARFAPLHEAIRSAGPTLPTTVGRFRAPDRILFDKVQVPAYKMHFDDIDAYNHRWGSGPNAAFTRLKNYKRNVPAAPNQRQKWRQHVVNSNRIQGGLASKLSRAIGINIPGGTKPRYVLKVPLRGAPPLIYYGTDTQLQNRLMIPNWGRGTVASPPPRRNMQVEHVVELQIGNWSENTGANEIDNFVLLTGGINERSGEVVRDSINRRIAALLRHPAVLAAMPAPPESATGTSPASTSAPPAAAAPGAAARVDEEAIQSVKRNFYLDFERAEGAAIGGLPQQLDRNDYWSAQDIDNLEHLEAVDVGSMSDLGNANEVFIFSNRNGGSYRKFAWSGPDTPLDASERRWLSPFEITGKQFHTDPASANQPNLGTLSVRFRMPSVEAQQEIDTLHFDVERALPGAQYAGFINRNQVLAELNRTARAFGVEVPGLSPVTFDLFDIRDTGLYLRGRILTNVPMLRGAQIDWELEDGDLRAFKTFTATDIGVPAPLRVDSAALTLAVGTRSGISARGRVDFGIERVGQGFLEARAQTGTGGRGQSGAGFVLAGGFDFDSKLFQPANITMRYENGQFSGEGELGIPSGKVRGVRSARITMSYAEGRFTANGTVQPAVPGVREGTLNVVYSEQDGLVISGSLQLAENPAIRSGSLDARVERKPDGTYKVRASGTAQPKIPGIDSQLTVTYDDGAFDAEVTAAFTRGMLRGSLRVAATNRPVDQATGQPAGEPTDQITVYGGGQVTIRFSPWLEGTAGIRLLANGEIEVSGSIGLPSTVNIFDARRFDRNIFRVNIDIPIIGVSVAGQRIGIFATIGGGLDLTAGIGPGQLRDLSLGVTYNPSHEDQTHVTGHGELFIPADAGLRLSIRGGIGAGIPIVSATAGIEVGGQLGLEGAARAAVAVDWTPQQGIVLDAVGEIYVEPKLKLDVSAYVEVTADLLFTSIDLYSKRWRLANYEFGSGLRFGVRFPVHYEEGRPFSISTDDLQFEIPQIDPESILASILD